MEDVLEVYYSIFIVTGDVQPNPFIVMARLARRAMFPVKLKAL